MRSGKPICARSTPSLGSFPNVAFETSSGVGATDGERVSQVDRKRQEEKMRRDQLSDQHLDLVEKQRLYFKTVKDFKEECRRNEILLSKLRAG